MFGDVVGMLAQIDNGRLFWGEVVGTGVLILLGDGVVAGVLLNRSKAQNSGWIVITWGWGMGVLFGVWLAIYLDAYRPWDGWIVASLALWVVGTMTGARSGNEYNAAGTAGNPAETARRWKRGNVLAAISTVAVVVILVLMIYKPGA